MDNKIGPLYFSREDLNYIRDGLYDTMWDRVNTEFDTEKIEKLAITIGEIIDKDYNK
jgi:hypothetical protein